jgi:hypothetical protein
LSAPSRPSNPARLFFTLLGLAVLYTSSPVIAQELVTGAAAVDSPVADGAADGNADVWRRTRFGWEDSRSWAPVSTLRPEAVPGMHPLAWSAILVLSVLSLALWAAGEDELGRMAPGLVAGNGRGDSSDKSDPSDMSDTSHQ